MAPLDYTNIVSDQQFSQWIDELERRGVREIGLDFEGEFNLHVYGNHLCLIQVFDGERFTIVDPFKVGPATLKRFLEHPDISKIIYDCASDGALVAEEFGIKLGPVTDLKPAVDLLAFPKRDLSTVLGEVLGIEFVKKKKFQMYNWMSRPINREAMEYALGDVAELFRLKDALFARLEKAGLMSEYLEKNRLQQPDGQKKKGRPRLFKSREFFMLNKAAQAQFERLFEVRDGIARDLNLPPNMVVENAALFELARGRLAPGQLRFNRRLGPADCRRITAAMTETMASAPRA
jgi:ribonuclease D